MKIDYFYEPHFPTECALLIQRALADPTSFAQDADINHLDAIVKETERIYPSRIAVFNEQISPLREVMDYVMQNLSVSQERLEFYFAQPAQGDFVLGNLIAHFEQLGINLENETPERREHILSAFFQTSVMPVVDENDLVATANALADWLDEHDLSTSYKWSLMQLYRHFDEYHVECRSILAEAENLYRDKENIWRPIFEKCINTFKSKIETENSTYIEDTLHVKFDADNVQLRPSLSGFNAFSLISFEIKNIWKGDYYFINLGCMVEELLSFDNESSEASELLYSRLKAISDKRRLEILLALHTEALCGQEIAEKVGLTPATISHHMNELVSNDFVDIVKEGTRLNYSYSNTGMKRFIEDISHCFNLKK